MTTTPEALVLVDDLPPPGTARRFNWPAVAERLIANPGEWGMLTGVARATAVQIRAGKYADFRPPSDWEVTTRRTSEYPEGKRVALYLRYVGPKR